MSAIGSIGQGVDRPPAMQAPNGDDGGDGSIFGWTPQGTAQKVGAAGAIGGLGGFVFGTALTLPFTSMISGPNGFALYQTIPECIAFSARSGGLALGLIGAGVGAAIALDRWG